LRTEHIALVNVCAGRRIVPEFLLFRADPAPVAEAALNLLGDASARKTMQEALRAVRDSFGGGGASQRAARAVLEEVERVQRGTG